MLRKGSHLGLMLSTIRKRRNGRPDPFPDVRPVVTGVPYVTQTLSSDTGTWSGTGPFSYAYQWKRNGTPISGATSSTYTLTKDDYDQSIRCCVIATGGAGQTMSDSLSVKIDGLPIDIVDTAPVAAYSVRKLAYAYSGNAIRVRRSSDNAEQDIGFSGLDLDTASLSSFLGASDGFVTTWYDQAGTRNAIQATSANQPKIYTSGTIELMGTRPGIRFLGPSTFTHLTTSDSFLEQNFSVIHSFQKTSLSVNPSTFVRLTGRQFGSSFLGNNNDIARCRFGLNAADDAFLNGAVLSENLTMSFFCGPNLRRLRLNNSALNENSNVTSNQLGNQQFRIGAFSTAGTTLPGLIGELLIWQANIVGTTEDRVHANSMRYFGVS